MNISKNQIKLIKSLEIKKYRKKENLFFCEGIKIFKTLLSSDFKIDTVYGTQEFSEQFKEDIENLNFVEVSENELKKISSLTTAQKVIALVKIPGNKLPEIDYNNELVIVLDKIQDPGNLGTIIRIADWFGIKNIICSSESVDVYNPKTVQATMGSIFSVKTYYINLTEIFQNLAPNIPVYGTFMDGENIYEKNLTKNGIIVMGNEANGISEEIENFITSKIAIPNFNKNKKAESLNIAIATAITCSEFRRK